jgi:uncharacterized protein (DUF1501 family)
LNRKEFIKQSALISSIGLFAPQIIQSCNEGSFEPFKGKKLVIVQLQGGMDGYHIISQKENDILNKLRPNLQAPFIKNGVKWIDDWNINPNFKIIADLIQKEWLMPIINIGYPDYNRLSHFAAKDMWETGSVVGDKTIHKTGWIGRLMDEKKLKPSWNPNPVLLINDDDTIIDKGNIYEGQSWKHQNSLANYDQIQEDWLNLYKSNLSEEFNHIYQTVTNNNNISNILKGLNTAQKSIEEKDMFGQFERVTECIQKELPFQIYNVTQTGYDTHHKQIIRLEPLALEMFGAINKMAKKLSKSGHWNDTLVFVYTEFGRTIEENANLGTDHGTANHAYILGGNLNKFNYTNQNKFETVKIAEKQYIKHKIDFRDIYYKIEHYLRKSIIQ